MHQAAHERGDFFERDVGHEALGELELVGDAGRGLALQKVAHELVGERGALGGGAFVEGALVAGQQTAPGPLEFRGGEAELLHPSRFTHHRLEAGRGAAFGDFCAELEHLQVPAEVRGAGIGAEEGRLRLPRDLGEPRPEHLHAERLHERSPVVAHRVFRFRSPLEGRRHAPALRFRIRHHLVTRRRVRRHHGVDGRGRWPGHGHVAEAGAHQRLRFIERQVAAHHHGHAVGAVPPLVEVAQALVRECAQHLRQADRQAVGVAAAREEHRQLLIGDARLRAQATAPFLEYHAAFLVDLFAAERRAAGEVAQRQQRLVDVALAVGRHVEHVDGLVEVGRGVDVRTKARADRLEERHQLTRFEVGAAVERHVLEEVREPALVVVFVDAAHVDREPHRHALGGPAVLPQEVAQAVGQPSHAHGRIDRQGGREGGRRGVAGRPGGWRRGGSHLRPRRHRQRRQSQDDESSTHTGTRGHRCP